MEQYQKLYTNAARTVIRFAEKFGYELPNNDRAEDLLQELILLKLEGDQRKTRAFLTEFFRGENRVEMVDLAGLDVNPEDLVVDRVYTHEQRKEVRAVVKTLPSNWRRAIEVRYLDGEMKTLAQTGSILGVTRSRVGEQERRAMKLLRAPARAKRLSCIL